MDSVRWMLSKHAWMCGNGRAKLEKSGKDQTFVALTAQEKAKIVSLSKRGMSISEISSLVKRSTTTVSRYVKEAARNGV